MATILLVSELRIASSYAENREVDAVDARDTVQFLLVGNDAWRVKTYALDLDVHVWRLGAMDRVQFEALAQSNTAKHYGDVLERTFMLEAADGVAGLSASLQRSGEPGALEVFPDGEAAFWVPAADLYETRSTPA